MRMGAVILLVTGTVAAALWAQSPAFDVATVKVNGSGDGITGFPGIRDGMVTARNASLRMLLRAAYDLSENRIIEPDWLDADRFDVTGKSPQGVPNSEMMPMLQTLLKERFHLAFHREMKQMPVFDMVVAKGGLKVTLSDPAHPFPTPPPNPGGAMNLGAGTMPQIAQRLTGAAGRPVLDKTGLEGSYGFLLIYTPLSAQAAGSAAGSGPPDFFTAVEQQMGLKLEPKNELIEVLVVDHADRTPTEN
jgi:uncharacterized protein (TIGR03435 family)